MAQAQRRKRGRSSQKRARLRGTAAGVWVRLRMAGTAADMFSSFQLGSAPLSIQSLDLLRRGRWRSDLSKRRSAGAQAAHRMNTWPGCGSASPSWRAIWSMRPGLRELGFAQMRNWRFSSRNWSSVCFSLDAIAAFNGVEVLQAVDHDQREEHGDGGGKDAHLAHAHRDRSLDQARVVKMLGEIELRRAHAAAALRLLRHQLGVALGDPRAPSRGRSRNRLLHMPPWFVLLALPAYCRSAALSLALRERGLRLISSSSQ
jgi:hypothetical protein